MAEPVFERTPDEILAVIERHKAEAKKATAEAKKASYEAAKMAAEAETAAIELAKKRHDENKRLAGDEFHRIYRFTEAVGEASVGKCMTALATWARLEPGKPMQIVFSSPGGDVISGMSLFDFIQEKRRESHEVTTKALGMAASMAGILLQAGDERVMTKESWLLIHEASFGVSGSFGDVEDRVKWIERVQDRILDIFAARCKLSKAELKRRWNRKDWWISSDEALKFGLIDRID